MEFLAEHPRLKPQRPIDENLRGPFGEGPGRTAYVMDKSKLPEPAGTFQWRAESDFRAGDAIYADPGLKSIFEQALRQGRAVVAR